MSDRLKIVLLGLILILIILIKTNPSLTFFTNIEETVTYIRNYHRLAPMISFLLILIQAQVPYVPFFILVGANGILFGFWEGLLISWLAAVTGAGINFWIARYLGHSWFVRHLNKKHLKQLERFSKEKGFLTVLICRLIPIIPTSLINIGAGISDMSFNSFLLASAFGKLPFAILYTYLGERIFKTKNLSFYLTIIVLFLFMIYFLYGFLSKRRNRLL